MNDFGFWIRGRTRYHIRGNTSISHTPYLDCTDLLWRRLRETRRRQWSGISLAFSYGHLVDCMYNATTVWGGSIGVQLSRVAVGSWLHRYAPCDRRRDCGCAGGFEPEQIFISRSRYPISGSNALSICVDGGQILADTSRCLTPKKYTCNISRKHFVTNFHSVIRQAADVFITSASDYRLLNSYICQKHYLLNID